MPTGRVLVRGLVLAQLACVLVAAAGDIYGSYLIKSRQISELAEGLEIVSQFMAPSTSSEVRCKKYALVLSGYYKDQSMDQFKLARLAQEPQVDGNAFKRITMDLLRDLYLSGVDQLLEEHLGEPCMQLIGCLRDIFYTRDAKARAYLNRKQLKRIVDQWERISSQSIEFLLDDEARHESLHWDELEKAVQLATVRLFMGDEARARAHFGAGQQVASQEPIKKQLELPKEKEEQEEKKSKETMEEAFSAERLAKSLMADGFYADSERLTGQLPAEHRKLMEQLNKWLHLLHHSLPLGARLADRCRAYSRLLGARPDQLNAELVERIHQEAGAAASTEGARFVPDANMRENFLFTVSVYPRREAGDGLWVSLIDCVSLWQDTDEHVRSFMRDSRHFLYAHLDPFLKPPTNNNGQPAGAHQ